MNRVLNDGVVVVGAGQAAGELATALRQQGYQQRITLLGAEAHLPYRRPPLSKDFLTSNEPAELLYLKPQSAYDQLEIEVRTSARVVNVDRSDRHVELQDGSRLAYADLVLATGGKSRTLTLVHAGIRNIHCIRTIEDTLQLKAGLVSGKRIAIIGGGFIGLELAATAVKSGLLVTVIEAASGLLTRAVAPPMSAYLLEAHRRRGVDVVLGAGVIALEGEPDVHTVVLSDGTRLAVDLVVCGIGMVPATDLAKAAGLLVDNGILTDACGRTADPHVYAVGDCANSHHDFLGTHVRLESIPSAMEQGRAVAAAICGKPSPAKTAPWFWSDQYELRLQMVGLMDGYDQLVVRGRPELEPFAVFCLRQGVLLAAQVMNRPADFLIAKKLVAARLAVSAPQLSDESTPLKSLLA